MSDFENHVRAMLDAYDRRLLKQEEVIFLMRQRINALHRRLTLLGAPDEDWEDFEAEDIPPAEIERAKREMLDAADQEAIRRGDEARERQRHHERSRGPIPLRPDEPPRPEGEQ